MKRRAQGVVQEMVLARSAVRAMSSLVRGELHAAPNGVLVPLWNDRVFARPVDENSCRDLPEMRRGERESSCTDHWRAALLRPSRDVQEFISSPERMHIPSIYLGEFRASQESNGTPLYGYDFSMLEELDDVVSLLSSCSEYSSNDDGDAPPSTPPEFRGLRTVGMMLPAAEAALLAYASGMFTWHRSHQWCGTCGSLTSAASGGHVRVCDGVLDRSGRNNSALHKESALWSGRRAHGACGAHHFPRTDPAVIMLVTREDIDACLLCHQPHWREGMYSTLAGFVEPGESLEEAVAREVHEEVGVAAGDCTYFGSQPWPFPRSLMVGYHAKALSHTISVDCNEIEDAQWFTREQMRFATGATTHEPKTPLPLHFGLPPRDSISRALIQSWLDE